MSSERKKAKKMAAKFFSKITRSTEGSALEDAYRIRDDGVATMVPAKLIKREQFQANLTKIKNLNIGSGSNKAKKK